MTPETMFTLVQVLDIIGLLQCVFILALIGLKASDLRRAWLAVAFFTVLGLGFGLPAAADPGIAPGYGDVAGAWIAETLIPAFSYLLILQLALERLPEPRHLSVLALPLLAAIAAYPLIAVSGICIGDGLCPEGVTVLRAFGVIPGAIVLLLLWLHRGLLAELRPSFWHQRQARDRYWVVLTLIVFNVLNIGVDLSRAALALYPGDATFVRTIFGLTFVYLVTTLVFRIEPRPVLLLGRPQRRPADELTPEEWTLAERIRAMITVERLYKDPTLRLIDVARHLEVSEEFAGRAMKGAFAVSCRVFLIDHRVDEAKRLLRETDLSVAQIAFDTGFDGLPSFNVVFKRITGRTPAEFSAGAVDGDVEDREASAEALYPTATGG